LNCRRAAPHMFSVFKLFVSNLAFLQQLSFTSNYFKPRSLQSNASNSRTLIHPFVPSSITTARMKTLAFFAALLVATVSAQSSESTTSIPYSNPATAFTTQTDSNGVITGQPTLVTSQPAQDTAQVEPASIYAGLSQGLNTVIVGNRTMTVDVSGSVTSVVTPTPTVAPTTNAATDTSSSSGSNTASASASGKSSGAAAVARMGAGALVGAGAVFAVFL
jgi:hypothetical protein